MQFKNLVVVAESTSRGKQNLGEAIDAAVAAFQKEEKVKLVDVKVVAEFGIETFGKALVTVTYKTPEKKK